MGGAWAQGLVSDLKAAGVEIGPGLGPAQRSSIEAELGLTLPPDLAELLEAGVPQGDRFPDWHGGAGAIRPLVAQPVQGLLFDVEKNGLWLGEWGERPASAEAAVEVAQRALEAAPVLVPLWAHRYLPTEPSARGNPVLSVMQADIVVYGKDLTDYFCREFHLVARSEAPVNSASVDLPFWGRFLA